MDPNGLTDPHPTATIDGADLPAGEQAGPDTPDLGPPALDQ